MNMAKNILFLIALMAYVIGTINGIGYSIYIGEWPTAVCIAVLSAMAFPTAKKMYNYLFVKEL